MVLGGAVWACDAADARIEDACETADPVAEASAV